MELVGDDEMVEVGEEARQELLHFYEKIEEMSDQLCRVIDDNFDITVTVQTHSEILQKLCMLINFLLDCSRKNIGVVEDQKAELEQHISNIQTVNQQLSSEIETRIEAQKNAAELYAEKVEISRMVGKAEVASTILHNVGNVLNSLNTSTKILLDNFDDKRLARAMSFLPEIQNAESIQTFISGNPKSEKILQYLMETIKSEHQHRQTSQKELNLLSKNIDHIKSVIQTQQSTAKTVSFLEDIDMRELINDACLLVRDSYQAHGVDLVFDDVEACEVKTDKHKVLQIFTNLLTNARDAVVEQSNPQQQVAISTERGDGEILIHFRDNGIGIDAAQQESIFQHGFTTKADGHGFGLHSCANTAKELEGELLVSSEGKGMGACFSLQLPMDKIVKE